MENIKNPKINTPTAIIVAGFLVMLAILITKGGSQGGVNGATNKDQTLSAQVGVNKEKFAACIKNTDQAALQTKIGASVEAAMKGVPTDQRGTPYSVIVGKNGIKTEVRGALPATEVQKLIDEVNAGKVTTAYTGEIAVTEPGDHLLGNPDAPIVVIEYSDYECPYCKSFHTTMDQIVKGSDGKVAWIYRHWPIHQGSLEKLIAAECVATLKGNDAFWKYTDLLFGLLNPTPAPITSQL
ncbi:MAG: thioredoxin domain-containing protein [Candidatus Paceibacterota bacterium]